MLSLLLIGLGLLGQTEPTVCVLAPGAPVWDVAAADLTGDDRAEILALCSSTEEASPQKYLAVFVADAAGHYPKTPSNVLPLEPSSGALFLAEADGKPPVELIVTSAQDIEILAYRAGEFAPLTAQRFDSLLPGNLNRPVFLEDIAMDFDDNGADAWLIPVASGFEVRDLDGKIGAVSCDVESDISGAKSITVSHHFPARELVEQPGWPRKGLAFVTGDAVDFAYGEDWSSHNRFKIPAQREEKGDRKALLSDLNSDGLPDLIVTETKGNVSVRVLTEIYMAQPSLTYSEQPSAVFTAKGVITSPWITDVDSDGRRDLVFLKFPFGLRNFVNYFLRNKVTIQIEAYMCGDEGLSPEPQFHESLTLNAPEDRRNIAYTSGDFNGDGWLDTAFADAAGCLVVHTGSPKKLVSDRPWQAIQVPAYGLARPYHLNDNANEDIVIIHPDTEEEKAVHVLLF